MSVAVERRSFFDPRTIREDLLSGLTVALVGLPQCLAYAMMSGLPPAYGLATAAVPGAIAAIAGKSAQVVTGPTNTTGLLILAALGPFLGESGLLTTEGLPVLATLTLLAGLLRVVGSYAGAAHLLRFLPSSVLIGFTAGAGILIVLMQLDEALGLPPVRGGGLPDEIMGIAGAIGSGRFPALPAVGVTVGTIAALILGKRYAPRWPTALLAILVAIVGAWALGLDASSGLPLVSDRSVIPAGWPPGALPTLDLDVIRSLLAPAIAIVFLGTLELTVSAKAGGARPDMRAELRAQGLANVVGAFTSAFPASASLTRSALLKLGGGKTRLAALSAALAVVPILVFGGTFAGYIPQASLAGVLFVTAHGMVDRKRLGAMWRVGRETRVLMLVTLVGTLTLPLEYAILLGAGLGLAIHLAKTTKPRLVSLTLEDGELRPLAPDEDPELVVIEVSGPLHYAAIESMAKRIGDAVPPSATRVILDLSHAQEMRYAALQWLEQLCGELSRRGATLELAGVNERFERMMARSTCEIPVTTYDPHPGRALTAAVEGRAHSPKVI
ncbi:MAG: SulP family inorganic anion transporter [Sandaracinaceae bacterium]